MESFWSTWDYLNNIIKIQSQKQSISLFFKNNCYATILYNHKVQIYTFYSSISLRRISFLSCSCNRFYFKFIIRKHGHYLMILFTFVKLHRSICKHKYTSLALPNIAMNCLFYRVIIIQLLPSLSKLYHSRFTET